MAGRYAQLPNERDSLVNGREASSSAGGGGGGVGAGITVALLVAVLALGVLTVTFGVLWGNERAGKGSYARTYNGCLYGSSKIPAIQALTLKWLDQAYGVGGTLQPLFATWDEFQPGRDGLQTFLKLYNFTTEADAVANFPAYKSALDLYALIAQTKNDPTVGELERIGLSFISRELDLWVNNTKINWYHNSFGSALFGVSWDTHILEAWTVGAIFFPEFAAEPGFDQKINTWLENFIDALPSWTTYYAIQINASNPHVHANVTIAEWADTWRSFSIPGDFAAYVCAVMSDAGQIAQCESNAAVAEALIDEFLTQWEGPYAALAASLRPDATPGLSFAHQGNESYRQWIIYHSELDLTPEEINAEGLSNVAVTQNNIHAAMQRHDPPLTLADFINKTGTCDDPDTAAPGGLDTCEENPLGDTVCAKPFLDALWARYGELMTYIPQIDGYLGRNSYTHRTDGTGGTYTFGGAYDEERSLYEAPSTINWGWKCVGNDGRKYYDNPLFATSTLIHEGIPGHQAQLPLQGELTCQVSNLTASTAWFEGWGLWSEGLGFVMNASDAQPLGLYQEPFAEAGRWSANLLRTARLVVDTRLHSLGNMSYLDCATYYGAIGLSYDYGLYECSRYITMPAQAVAYWLGKNQFQVIVDIVQGGLGADFDYREFLLLVSKFGGLGLFSDLENLATTYVLWKQKDPAAITSFGYSFFVNDFYRQAAPIVAKGGKDIASFTAVNPAKKRAPSATATTGSARKTMTVKQDMPSLSGTALPPLLRRIGYKLRPRQLHGGAKKTPARMQNVSPSAKKQLDAMLARRALHPTAKTATAAASARRNKRTMTVDEAMKKFKPAPRTIRMK